jgi:uncharacterized membrane protein (DUF106 family)
MARTETKVESLIEENPSMDDALATLLTKSDGGSEELEWGDIRDDLSSGQWGRLIEKGVLVDGTEGFVIDDPDAVREAIGEAPTISTDTSSDSDGDSEGVSWTKWDKGAAVVTLGMFAGYSISSVRNAVGSALDVFLGFVDLWLPFYVVVMVLALFTGLYSTLLQANLMDMDVMSEHQDRMKAIQEKRKKAKERDDDEALEQIQKEQMDAMGDQLGMFKAQFRPMVWIMVLTIPVFLWMYWKILDGHIAADELQIVMPLAGEVSWQDGILGPIQAWIVWYFLCSMGFTQIIRKSLDIQTTPT